MTTLQQAAQQALECIERCNKHGWILADYEDEVYASIDALKAALAQPEQEPSQWRDMVVVTLVREGVNKHKARELADHFAAQRKALALAQPGPEAHSYCYVQRGTSVDVLTFDGQPLDAVANTVYPLYTAPPAAQRPWQGLTDEEIEMIEAGIGYMGRSVTAIIKEAEAKLKERNT